MQADSLICAEDLHARNAVDERNNGVARSKAPNAPNQAFERLHSHLIPVSIVQKTANNVGYAVKTRRLPAAKETGEERGNDAAKAMRGKDVGGVDPENRVGKVGGLEAKHLVDETSANDAQQEGVGQRDKATGGRDHDQPSQHAQRGGVQRPLAAGEVCVMGCEKRSSERTRAAALTRQECPGE